MKKILLLSIVVLINKTYAQLEYSFTKLNAAYTEITGTNANEVWEEGNIRVKMPFSFKYFDRTYDSVFIGISSVFFSPNFMSDYDNVTIGQDNFSYKGNSPSNSPISYTTTGTAPNRIFIVQYKDMTLEDLDDLIEVTENKQIWLYENGHHIEFRFGASVNESDLYEEFYYGLIDFDNSPYLALSGTESNTTLVRVINAGSFKGINYLPSSGTVFRFSPNENSSTTFIKNNSDLKIINLENQLSLVQNTNFKITIMDINGKEILVGKSDVNNQISIEKSSLNSGIYVFKIEDTNGINVFKWSIN